MRRLRYLLFTTFAALSLALCIASGAFWILRTVETDTWQWSHSNMTQVRSTRAARFYEFQIIAGGGDLELVRTTFNSPSVDPAYKASNKTEFKYVWGMPRFLSLSNPGRFGRGTTRYFFQVGDFGAATSSGLAGTGTWHTFTFRVPMWFALLTFAIVPVAWEFRYRKGLAMLRRLRKGLCPACGYDMRASPDRCPECGHQRAVRLGQRQLSVGTGSGPLTGQ